MTSVRLPDLWLKIEMALAVLPPETPANVIKNATLVQCVRGGDGRASTFNQWMVGDNSLRIADDVHFLAATLECLVAEGVE